MDKKTTDIVAYVTWIGWFVAFFAGDKKGSIFHLNQALVIFLGMIAASVITCVPFVGILGKLMYAFLVVCWIIGLVYACQGQDKEVPLIGQIKILN